MNNRISQLLAFLQEDEADSFSRYALALEYLKDGNPSEAALHFQMIVKMDSEYLAVYYQYGKLLESQGLIAEALSVFESGIEVARKQKNLHTLGELQSAIDSMD